MAGYVIKYAIITVISIALYPKWIAMSLESKTAITDVAPFMPHAHGIRFSSISPNI